MTGCYLTTLPRQFMRGVADFDPDYASAYFIPRETVSPPQSLRRRVWPELDRWLDAHLGRPGATETVDPNIAAGGHLQLLDKLRDVFLQVRSLLAINSIIDLTLDLFSLLYRTLSFTAATTPTTPFSATHSLQHLSIQRSQQPSLQQLIA